MSQNRKAVGYMSGLTRAALTTTYVPGPEPCLCGSSQDVLGENRHTLKVWALLSCLISRPPSLGSYAWMATESATLGPGQPTHYHSQPTAVETVPRRVLPLR